MILISREFCLTLEKPTIHDEKKWPIHDPNIFSLDNNMIAIFFYR